MRYRPIRRNSEFGRVYARGKSYVNPGLVMYVLKTRSKKTRVVGCAGNALLVSRADFSIDTHTNHRSFLL